MMQLYYLATLTLLAQLTLASPTIDELCAYELTAYGTNGIDIPAIVCLRADQPLDQFPTASSASIVSDAVRRCCPQSETCLLTNQTDPEVVCYGSGLGATGSFESTTCNLQNNKCVGKEFSASTDGVLTITSIVNGKGITDSSRSSGSSSSATSSSSALTTTSSGKPSGAAALAFARSNGRLLVVALIAAIGVGVFL